MAGKRVETEEVGLKDFEILQSLWREQHRYKTQPTNPLPREEEHETDSQANDRLSQAIFVENNTPKPHP